MKKIKQFKKYFIILFVIILSLFFSISVSAAGDPDAFYETSSFENFGVTFTNFSGEVWDVFGSGRRFSPSYIYVNETHTAIRYAYDYFEYPVSGSPVAIYSRFSIVGDSYGTLTLTVTSGSNTGIYYDIFNGLYDNDNNKLASFDVVGNTYVLKYTGNIPSSFSVNTYFTYNDRPGATILYDISYTPANPANLPIYEPYDKTQIDHFEQAEQSAFNYVQYNYADGYNEIVKFPSLLADLGSNKSLAVVSNAMQYLLDKPFAKKLLIPSLAFGTFAFIIGIASIVSKAPSSPPPRIVINNFHRKGKGD